jgi:hypothetical protein
MKTTGIPPRSDSGSVLLVTIVSVAIMGVMLASHLALASHQRRAVSRSQVWNECVPVAEAGIEEGLMNLNVNGVAGLMNNGNGWYQYTFTNGTFPGAVRILGPGAERVYWVRVEGGSSPTVVSDGFVRMPNSGQYLRRTIRATTTAQSPFPVGILTRGQITMNGNNVEVDSYDSNDPLHSTSNGQYTASLRKTNGNVATILGIVNAFNVGNNDIYGWAATGPGGTVKVGPNGFVKKGIRNDANFDIPDATVPFNSGFPPLSGAYGGTTYKYYVGDGDYTITGNFAPTGGTTAGVKDAMVINGNARLYIDGSLNLSSGQIVIGTNASVQIYVKTGTLNLGGNGVFNPNGRAPQVTVFGLPGVTGVSFGGNAQFVGGLYAPNAALQFNGGGNNKLDFMGALTVKSITLNGHFSVHYDEAFQNFTTQSTFKVASWQEL